jgi:hypothetical protein
MYLQCIKTLSKALLCSQMYIRFIMLKPPTLNSRAGMVAHTCNPSTWEAEAGGPQVSRTAYATQ